MQHLEFTGLVDATIDHGDLPALFDALAGRTSHPGVAGYCRDAADTYRHLPAR